jgi:hypothetical protein
MPEEMPEGPFDLIVASEVLYYFDRETMLAALRGLESALAPGGTLLTVHWRHQTRTYPLQGDEVHEAIRSSTTLSPRLQRATPDYRLELYEDDRNGETE